MVMPLSLMTVVPSRHFINAYITVQIKLDATRPCGMLLPLREATISSPTGLLILSPPSANKVESSIVISTRVGVDIGCTGKYWLLVAILLQVLVAIFCGVGRDISVLLVLVVLTCMFSLVS
jgi:hypothetical protein